MKAGHQHAMHKHKKNKQARTGKKLGSDEYPGVEIKVSRQIYVRGQKERDTEHETIRAWSMSPDDIHQAGIEMTRSRMKLGYRQAALEGKERWQAELIQQQQNANGLQGQANRALMASRPGSQFQDRSIPVG